MSTIEGASTRVAGPDDSAMLYDICRKAYTENFAGHWNPGGLEWYLERVYSLEGIKVDLQDANTRYYVACVDNQPAGFMKLKLDSSLDGHSGAGLEVEKIYFRSAHQGKGLGKSLMNHAIQTAVDLKKQFIWLGVIDTNPAIAFYKKLGFNEFDKVRLDLPYFKDELRGMWRLIKSL
ncbi:MAG TPA: GNAT family N-acetyltransferase [Cyclobacteriaceae bacterium]|nr:GNAT family N-acetyltransferase [Cyclobacteriaceae bacterium]